MIQNTIISVQHLSKSFPVGVQMVPVLKDVSFTVEPLDFLIIFGPSGCGKSTLLHTLIGLEPPTSGKVIFLGKDLYGEKASSIKSPVSRRENKKNKTLNTKQLMPNTNIGEDERSEFRKRHIGMVYQQPNWIRSLTVVENVAFPLLLLGQEREKSLAEAREMLAALEMSLWQDYLPSELSSGQQQRVALARALINSPKVIIADEPTGNLDYESGQELMELLVDLNKKQGHTIIMVTHDLEYLDFATKVIRMLDGRLVAFYEEKDKEKLMAEVKGKRGNGE
ncbi:MAG: Lipoprotein-releasing system ATP-binding protein LolD [bacterium ADurb.BinA186]|nr:MAG: Lipoprotein-releasing system ATP-binding protein LolD [bacterium ADurb.BinA186]